MYSGGKASKRYRSPPKKWIEKLQKGNKFNKAQTAAIRRQLILQSEDPSVYSTLGALNGDDRSIKLDDSTNVGGLIPKIPNGRDAFKFDKFDPKARRVIYGFFHPFANAGGGGERVLWQAVKATLEASPVNIVAIYTCDYTSRESRCDMLNKAKDKFAINLIDQESIAKRIVFVYLPNRNYLTHSTYPIFTLLGQALGSAYVAYLGLFSLVPDVWIDTMGYPFAYPVVTAIISVPIAAYVHYPLISSDMISSISCNSVFNIGKYVYWKLFALLYTWVGSYASVVMTNSTWTNNHIQALWWWGLRKEHIRPVFPPCNTEELATLTLDNRSDDVICIAQFRPEKRHDLIIEEFAKFLSCANLTSKPHLILTGSCRDEIDEATVSDLRVLARKHNLVDNEDISFVINPAWSEIKTLLSKASIGVNAMWNEHFGIVVVEYMAAGLIPVVHFSAGPRYDIVTPYNDQVTGYHFTSVKDKSLSKDDNQVSSQSVSSSLSEALSLVYELSSEEKMAVRQRGRDSVTKKFLEEEFDRQWIIRVNVLAKLEAVRRGQRVGRANYD
ncbi:hypothetical protein NADFUDRAFT_24751 [Nadsonia fulvescens var. elongata DSM 6958]|uniref:GDP-Man:Man(3)GlcNAc(2)-PP-Dol alpha-1,2-mannosyltransferase n=1 Tax=Nadsonia fulvescens var. elongata DSM 6958 TaxID=857566 RepID=A0A1E3PKR1_9ASCO|nr:hypothetical protein NADFUDRAFT_24751 [Nadsonia fulvescens var. elongata DSM 6958]